MKVQYDDRGYIVRKRFAVVLYAMHSDYLPDEYTKAVNEWVDGTAAVLSVSLGLRKSTRPKSIAPKLMPSNKTAGIIKECHVVVLDFPDDKRSRVAGTITRVHTLIEELKATYPEAPKDLGAVPSWILPKAYFNVYMGWYEEVRDPRTGKLLHIRRG